MKPVILRKIMLSLLGGLMMVNLSGCGENKNSREWIENKVSEVSRVYPTENLFDLFEEFPEGFEARSTLRYLSKENATYSQKVSLIGDPNKQTITGTIKNVKSEGNPYRETVLLETEVTYTTDGYIFSNPDFFEDDLIYKGFLFQRLKLDKSILSQLALKDRGYDEVTGDASIRYFISGPELAQFFGISEDEQLELRIGARRATLLGHYYSHPMSFKGEGVDYNEGIIEFGGKVNE